MLKMIGSTAVFLTGTCGGTAARAEDELKLKTIFQVMLMCFAVIGLSTRFNEHLRNDWYSS